MRKSLVALFIATALPALAFAMPGGMHDGPHGGKRAPHMFQDLDLTREQQQKLREFESLSRGGKSTNPESEGFFTKAKELWEDLTE